MKRLTWLFGVALLVAGCEGSHMVSGPTMGPPQGSLDPKGPLWLGSGGNSVAISRLFYDAAGISAYPSTVCWIGEFNNWAQDCRVQSEYDPATKAWPFPFAAAQSAGISQLVFGRCSRLSFFNKSNSSDWLKVDEFLEAMAPGSNNIQAGYDNLTTEQKNSLRAENGRWLPAVQFVQGSRVQICT